MGHNESKIENENESHHGDERKPSLVDVTRVLSSPKDVWTEDVSFFWNLPRHLGDMMTLPKYGVKDIHLLVEEYMQEQTFTVSPNTYFISDLMPKPGSESDLSVITKVLWLVNNFQTAVTQCSVKVSQGSEKFHPLIGKISVGIRIPELSKAEDNLTYAIVKEITDDETLPREPNTIDVLELCLSALQIKSIIELHREKVQSHIYARFCDNHEALLLVYLHKKTRQSKVFELTQNCETYLQMKCNGESSLYSKLSL